MLEKRKVLLLVKKYLHGGNPIMNRNLNEKELYRRKIIEMIKEIENIKFLRQIWTILQKHMEKRGD